jgi:hypothetical protein
MGKETDKSIQIHVKSVRPNFSEFYAILFTSTGQLTGKTVISEHIK